MALRGGARLGPRAPTGLLAVVLLALAAAGLSAGTAEDPEIEALLAWLEIRLGRELDIVEVLSLRVVRDEGVTRYELEVYKVGRLVVELRAREGTYALAGD